MFGQIPRWSREWKTLYKLRQSVERVFKGLKESRRLERHCIRVQQHREVMTALQTWQVVAIFESHFLPSAATHLPDSSCKKEGHGEES